MDRILVGSSNISSIGYDAHALVLEVEFQSGSVYQYFDVPEAVYEQLMAAASKGTFLNTTIKSSYRYARL